ncbi:Regulatory protein PchR [Paenibacillus konkukensis]|uniref:Regulatory protein PchR n=1 Tax=Paenibacillus konkukensis TaxID=2020716 RepID=A0ABY4RI21_9BACL|nr:AraC family transcriptional regulator [Paenibacillus konkukensis]UQZ81254.1 Regulatory protein PchR [Paenibacillus konkukensis]
MEQIIRSDTIHGYFDGLSAYVADCGMEDSGEQHLVLSPLLGEGSISRLKIRQGVEVVITDMVLEEEWDQYIHEKQVLEINYCFSGLTDCYYRGNRFKSSEQSGNVYSVEDGDFRLVKQSKQRYQFVEIRMSPEQMLRYFEHTDDYRSVENWLEGQMGRISPLQDCVELKRAVTEIVRSPYRRSLKKLHMESKIMEIILLVLEPYTRAPDSPPGAFLKKHDIEKLYAAKGIIAERLENPLSLRELARVTELNEFKLKKGFKQLFGMTVFEYVRDRRLEKGVLLMQVEQLNVGEAAAAVGYNNPSNFSAAFYKKYGCTPAQYVKLQKQ